MIRIMSFFVLIWFTLSSTNVLDAFDGSRETLIRIANQELKQEKIFEDDYFKDTNDGDEALSTSPHLVGERNLILYGNPWGDEKDNRFRYLGYTMNDSPFTNYLFPNDVTSPTSLWDRNWVENPKKDSRTKNRTEVRSTNIFNNNPTYEESIRLGLKLISRKNPDGSLMDFPEDRLRAKQWHRYVHVYIHSFRFAQGTKLNEIYWPRTTFLLSYSHRDNS